MKLTIAGYGPKESAHGRGLSTIRDAVGTESSGEVSVDVIWNIMDLGRPNLDLFEMVGSGELFMCYFSTSYQAWQVPELNVIETPYIFRDLAHAHRCLDGSLGSRLRDAVRSRTAFELLGYWDNGFRHMTNRLRPILTPDDVSGMMVRMQPNEIHEALIRAWGATPVAIDLKPAVEMIARLEVDAQENPLANSVAYGVDQVHRHWTMSGHLYGARGLFANRRVYEGLPDDVRNVVDGAVADAIAVQRSAAEEYEALLRSKLESSGHDFVDLTTGQLQTFIDRSKPAIDLAHQNLPEELFGLAEDG